MLLVLVLVAILPGCEEEPEARIASRPLSMTAPTERVATKPKESWRKPRLIPVEEAVERLQPHVDVPVVLPRDRLAGLPNLRGWLADPKYLSWGRDQGIRYGTMKLLRHKQMLILTYGLVSFDGCGGTDTAIPTAVAGQPAYVSIVASELWSDIYWPMGSEDTTAAFGLGGTFEGWQMVRLAESMELARVETLDADKSC